MKAAVLSQKVKIFRTLGDLEELRPFWEASKGHRDSQIDFFRTVVSTSQETVEPYVVVIYRNGEPGAMLAARIDHTRLEFGVGYVHFGTRAKILRLVNGALRGKDSEESRETFVRVLMEALKCGDADVVSTNFLPVESEFYKLLTRVPRFATRDHLRVVQPHFTAVLPKDMAEFYRGLSSKARWQLKSKGRKFETSFPDAISVRSVTESKELDFLLNEVERVAATTYQRGLGVGFINNLDTRSRWELKAQKGWLRAYLLYVQGQPCAFWTGDIVDGVFRSEFLGYDASFAQHSPGTYLILKVIESLIADPLPVGVIDFATGPAQYKEVLGTQRCEEAAAFIFATSIKGLQLSLLSLLCNGTRFVASNLLGRTRFLGQIKKFWRDRLRQGVTQRTTVADA